MTRIVNIFIPYIVAICIRNNILPQISIGLISLIGIVITFFAKETFGKGMAETKAKIEEERSKEIELN